jgi:hypothetical protein
VACRSGERAFGAEADNKMPASLYRDAGIRFRADCWPFLERHACRKYQPMVVGMELRRGNLDAGTRRNANALM